MEGKDIDLARFNFNTDDIVKGAAVIKSAIDEIKAEQKELTEQGKTASVRYVENAASLKTLNSEYNNHIKYLSESQKAVQESILREQKLDLVLNQEVTTIKEAREQNKLLNQLRNETNVTTTEGQAQLADLNRKLNENNALIKDNVDEYTKQKIGIGDYSTAIKDAFQDMNIFNGGITVFIARAQQAGGAGNLLKNSFNGIAQGIMGATKASLAFLATPLGAVIGALGVALGLVINYLKSTQEGMDKITSITRPLIAIFESLKGVAQTLGKSLFEAFSNPKKTLTELVDFIKNNVMNRFKAFGVMLEAIENRDWKGLRNGIAQAVTGVEDLEDKIVNGAKATADFLREAAEKGAEVDRLTKEIENDENNLILLRARNLKLIKEQELITKDKSKTQAEINAALQKALELSDELTKAEQDLLDKKIKVKEIEHSYNDTSRADEGELMQLQADRLAAEEQGDQRRIRFQQVQNRLKQEGQAQAKKAQEEAIQLMNDEIALARANAGFKAKTLQEEIEFEEMISAKKIEVLKAELKAKKKNQVEYDTAVKQIENENAKRRAELAIQEAEEQLRIKREEIAQRREMEGYLTAQLAEQKKAENQLQLEREKEFQKQRLELGLQNQKEYDDAIRELAEATRIANREIDLERQALEHEEKVELEILNFEEQQLRAAEQGATAFELEQARLQEELRVKEETNQANFDNGLISEEVYQARKRAIIAENKAAEEELARQVEDNKINIAEQGLSTLSKILGKESAAGKAVAVAQATIDTYKAAVAAYAAGSSIGGPAGVVMGPVSAGLAVAAGIANVKKILSTKVPGGGGGGGSAPSAATGGRGIGGADIGGGDAPRLGDIPASQNANVQQDVQSRADNANITASMEAAVERGASRGTESGSQSGITNLSSNRQIQQSSSF